MNCTALGRIFILLFSLAATKFRALNHRSACVLVCPLHLMHTHARPKVRRPPACISRLAAEGSCHPTGWKEMVLRPTRRPHDRRQPLGRRLKGSRGTKVPDRPSTALGDGNRERREERSPEGEFRGDGDAGITFFFPVRLFLVCDSERFSWPFSFASERLPDFFCLNASQLSCGTASHKAHHALTCTAETRHMSPVRSPLR